MFQTVRSTEPTVPEVNDRFIHMIDQGGEMQKTAQEAATDYIRDRLREESFLENILPPITITNADLDLQATTDKPSVVQFKEPGSPAAVTLPFGQLPYNEYIMGPRFLVSFDRIVSPKFVADVDTLRTYRDIDIRQVISDNSIKDMGAEQDIKFLGAVNALLSNGLNIPSQTVDATGVVQWQPITGGITRETISEAKTVMMKTPSKFSPKKALTNMVTFTKFEAWGRDEVGGDLAEEVMINGFTERRIGGVDYVVTIKRELVPDGVIFWFSAPKNMGKFMVLEDTTMYVDKRAYMIEFFAYKTIGGTIANVAGCARTDFTI